MLLQDADGVRVVSMSACPPSLTSQLWLARVTCCVCVCWVVGAKGSAAPCPSRHGGTQLYLSSIDASTVIAAQARAMDERTWRRPWSPLVVRRRS